MQEKANKFRFAVIKKQKVFIRGGGNFYKPRLYLTKISQKIWTFCKNLISPHFKNQHNNLQILIKTCKGELR